MHPRTLLIGFLLLLSPVAGFAQEIVITPVTELEAADAERRFAATNTSNVAVEGRGGYLRIEYSSSHAIDADIAPMVVAGKFDPSDLVHFTLPAGKDQRVLVDLRQSPSWSPWKSRYYLAFYEPAKGARVDINTLRTEPAGLGKALAAALQQLQRREEYQASTPHKLQGYGGIGISLAFIIGVAGILAALATYRNKGITGFLAAGVIATGLYGLWFGTDLLRWSVGHASSWITQGTYGQAESMYLVAEELQEEAERGHPANGVFVCTNSTDFRTKILRYLVFPVPVSIQAEDVNNVTHMLVDDISDWSYQNGVLHCGRIDGPATKVREFADGSVLFSVYK